MAAVAGRKCESEEDCQPISIQNHPMFPIQRVSRLALPLYEQVRERVAKLPAVFFVCLLSCICSDLGPIHIT